MTINLMCMRISTHGESDIHISSENYEENGNDVKYPSRTNHVSYIYALRSGLVGKKKNLRFETHISLGCYPPAPKPCQPLEY